MRRTPLPTIYVLLLVSGLFFSCGGGLDGPDASVEGSTSSHIGEDMETEEVISEDESSADCTSPAPLPLLNEIIVRLNPLFTKDDLNEGGRKIMVCWDEDKLDYQRYDKELPASVDKGNCKSIPIGKNAIVGELRRFLYQEDLSLLAPYLIESCNCSQEIHKIKLGEDVPLDILNAIASKGAKTPPEDQGEHMLAGIGFNYELDAGPIDSVTPVKGSYCKYPVVRKISNTDKQKLPSTEGSKYDFDSLTIKKSGCTDLIIPFPEPIERDNEAIIKVGIMDTGLDPAFRYRRRGNNNYYHENFFSTGFTPSDYDSLPISEGFPFSDLYNCQGVFGWDFINQNSFPEDNHSHGTHLADIILSGNSEGQDSIRVTALKIGDLEERENEEPKLVMNLWDAICATHYAVDHDIDILNMSWGYRAPEPDPVFKKAIKRAVDAGILIVASAGNDTLDANMCPQWPSSFSQDFIWKVISVAALGGDDNGTPSDEMARFSNYSHAVTIAAPGTALSGGIPLSGNERRKLSGTSMAAAYVTRELAKGYSKCANKNGRSCKGKDAKNILRDYSRLIRIPGLPVMNSYIVRSTDRDDPPLQPLQTQFQESGDD